MKTTVDIAEPLVRRIKILAAQEGTTMRELVEESLRLLLDERARRAPFTLREAHVEGKGLQTGAELRVRESVGIGHDAFWKLVAEGDSD